VRAFLDGHGCIPGKAEAEKNSTDEVDVVNWEDGEIVTSFVGGIGR